MRIARCTNDLSLQLLGNKASVSIGRDWQGDLDEVIGEVEHDGKTIRTTVADALGHHLTPENFDIESPARKRAAAAARPQTEE